MIHPPAVLTPLPTYFKNVFSCLEMDMQNIVDCSLIFDISPKSLKTAVVKRLLKKVHLDPSMLNNYISILNLPFIGNNIKKQFFDSTQ